MALPIASPEPERIQNALRLLGAVQSGRVWLDRPMSTLDVARGRQAPALGPASGRPLPARRAALSR